MLSAVYYVLAYVDKQTEFCLFSQMSELFVKDKKSVFSYVDKFCRKVTGDRFSSLFSRFSKLWFLGFSLQSKALCLKANLTLTAMAIFG